MYIYIYVYNWGQGLGHIVVNETSSMAGAFSWDLFCGFQLRTKNMSCARRPSPSALKWMPWGSTGVHSELKRMFFLFRNHFPFMASK